MDSDPFPISSESIRKRSRPDPQRGEEAVSVIPAGAYPGIDTETPSIGFRALWIVSADAADELIYEITKALWNDATRRLLDAHDPLGKEIRLESALDDLPVPLHPGAKRFYREIGLPVDEEGLPGRRP